MILRKCIRDVFWKSVTFAALLEVHMILVVLYFPDFERNASNIKKAIPSEFFKQFVDLALTRGYDSYIGFQHFAKAIATFGTFAAIFMANSAVAGEVHDRTAEFLFSRPWSRTRILATKYLTGALFLILPVWIVSPTAIPLARLIDEPVAIAPIFLQTIHSSVFMILLYSMTFVISSWSSNAMSVAFGALGIALLEFVLLIIQGVSHSSIYKLSDMGVSLEIMRTERLPFVLEVSMAGSCAALFAISLAIFKRRDF
ncbi:MAG: ABC transporter permease [Planctomycetes bacterium]|nr:ABC transporter permease [Planctomycetota bacterium]